MTAAERGARRPEAGLVVALGLVAAPVVAATARLGSGWLATGDVAVLAARAGDVGTRATPRLGMPSTAGGDDPVHHLGPLEMWLVGVARWLLDAPWTPLAAVVAVNLLSVGAVAWWARRLGPPAVGWLAVAATGAVGWSLRGEILASPFNPYAALLPFTAFLVTAAAASLGIRGAAVGAVLAGSWAAQAHLAFVPATAAVTAAAVGLWWWTARTPDPTHPPAPEGADRWRRRAGIGVLAVVLWSGPLLDALVNGGGNLVVLAQRDEGPALGLGSAVNVVANGLVPLPVVARSDAHPLSLLGPAPAWVLIATAALLAHTGITAWRRRGTPRGALAAVALAATAGGLATVAVLPDLTFNALALHNYLWLWPVAAALWAGLVADLATGGRRVVAGQGWAVPRLAAPVAVAAAVVLTGAATLPPVRGDTGWERTGTRRAVELVLPAIDRSLAHAVVLDGGFDVFPVQAGLAHELERRGVEVVVPPRLERAWGRRAHRPPTYEVVVAPLGDPGHHPPGADLLGVIELAGRPPLVVYLLPVPGAATPAGTIGGS